MNSKETGRRKFAVGLMQFLWAELKTMNFVKIKSLYKVCVGYLAMKYSKSQSVTKKKVLRQETTYRISS